MFKKWDILLAAVLVLLIGASWLLFLPQNGAGPEAYALVQVNGEDRGRYPLSEDTAFTVEWDGHRNLVEIRNGKVSVTEANCGNGQCIKMGEIDSAGEMIVCLPNKMVITVESEGPQQGPDVIVR
ncbi:MAG: NusG domain II-containing protein [Clostridiales bacterium]|nr:NusG domain II-containing protein [Clostridiales bacterium]